MNLGGNSRIAETRRGEPSRLRVVPERHAVDCKPLGARQHIKERHVANCLRVDPAYDAGVARALGVDIKQTAE
jgi:hypothetical protein